MDDQELSDLLARAVSHLNVEEVAAAEPLLGLAIDKRGEIPQAQMLMGVVRLKQGRYGEADILLSKALEASPRQPMVLFYLGEAQRAQGALDAALVSYRSALHARPGFLDAELALAATLRAAGHPVEAKAVYQRIVSQAGQSPAALAGLGATLNDLEDYGQAERILVEGLTLPADKIVTADMENSLGTAQMRQRRFAEALPHFERALVLAPTLLMAEKNRATVLEHLNRPDRATAAYRRVLAQDPSDLETHLLLNELLHRTRPQEQLLRSYDEAARVFPSSPSLPTAKGDQLLLLERFGEAVETYQRAIRLAPTHVAAHIGLARTLVELQDNAGAIAAFETAQRTCPNNPDLRTAFAFCLLRQADAIKAQTFAEQAVAMAPFSQAAQAVLGLCYRANSDSREDFLNGYDHLIQVFDLDPPDGYKDMTAFHHDLRAHLDPLHTDATQFFSQTLRGGSRAPEDIFAYQHPLRDGLKARIVQTLARYIGAMKDDAAHPFLGRRRGGVFKFSGSWSSRMQGGGFHVNHIHTGWISSVYYVDVPDVATDTKNRPGWLKFGEPSVDLGFRDAVRRVVQPKPGRLVLFPSYLWHGTMPFQSSQPRTTIAFDAIPLQTS